MKRLDLAAFSDKDLVVTDFELGRQSARLKFKHALGQVENSSEIRVLRRNRARLKTELRRREMAEGLSKDELCRRHSDAIKAVGASDSSTDAVGGQGPGLLAGLRRRLSGESKQS